MYKDIDDEKKELYRFYVAQRKNESLRLKTLFRNGTKKAVIHSTLVTTYGLVRNGYHSDFVNVITMDAIFKE